MTLDVEGVVDGGVCLKESLRCTGGFETLHAPFSLADRQVRRGRCREAGLAC